MLFSRKKKSIVRPIIKAQERIERIGKKRSYKSSGADLNRYIINYCNDRYVIRQLNINNFSKVVQITSISWLLITT